MYRIAQPDEYLAVTGWGIKNVKIVKTGFVYPGQRCKRFSVQPRDIVLDLQAMTKEKLQFLLPVVFTVGPNVGFSVSGGGSHVASQGGDDDDEETAEEDPDALMKYAMLLAQDSKDDVSPIDRIVKGVIEGETRVLVSSMTMEEIFASRESFKRRIRRNIAGELGKFGLKIYNANVKELRDAVGSEYFASLSRKAHEGATNQARIDVAAAQHRGTVGEAELRGQQERDLAKINATTAVQKTERDIERAKAEATLATEKAILQQDVNRTELTTKRNLEAEDEDLKKMVESKRAAAEIERLRASEVAQATIAREAAQQKADAKAYEMTAYAEANLRTSKNNADADAYRTKMEAETQAATEFARQVKQSDAAAYKSKADADAAAYSASKGAAAHADRSKTEAEAAAFRTTTAAVADSEAKCRDAEAVLAMQLRKAEGLNALASAYSKMADAFGGPEGLLRYMMIEKGTYVQLARANADAIKGLEPKISVWNTGPEAGAADGSSSSNTQVMRNVYQMLPPLMSTINEQTGITLPEWQFGRMAGAVNQADKAVTNGKK